MSQRYLGGIITANPTAPTLTSASGVWTTEQQFQNIANWPKSTGLVSRSVRFRSSASAYFSRTPASASNRTTWTWSGWVKRGSLGSVQELFMAGAAGTDYTALFFNSTDTLCFHNVASSANAGRKFSSAVYRDPSAWYHIVAVWDTTNATAGNRMLLYVNGVQLTAFSPDENPSSSQVGQVNNNAIHTISKNSTAASQYVDGYMTEINFIDGQALTPSYFGFTDGNGVWQPATYSGTYGTNGFYLNFSDNSAATATTIGKDYSGNGNNWTPNNISVTAGATYDSMLDVPTPYADGGNGRGNYAVMNPIVPATSFTPKGGNLDVSATGTFSSSGIGTASTIAVTGSYYFEITLTTNSNANAYFGVSSNENISNATGFTSTSWAFAPLGSGAGNKYTNSSSTAFAGGSYTANGAGVVFGVAVDATNGKFYVRDASGWINGTSVDANPTTAVYTGLPSTLYPAIGMQSGTSQTVAASINFGQRPFTYTPPTGFKALNTQNLPTPTISNGATVMAATLWTGNGTSQSISNAVNGISFQPDMVWVKDRSAARSHVLIDAVRGTGLTLFPNETTADQSNTDRITSFNSNGFSVGAGLGTNANTETYVGWQWNAGGSTVTNTSGLISSQVRANTTAGFSVVTYTGNGLTNQSVGHGLNATPGMVIIKQRDGTANWLVHHQSQPTGYTVYLNLTNAQDSGTSQWGTSAQTSSLFYVGYTAGATGSNVNASTYVAYCWAAVAGYSAFGSYVGTSTSDGTFVYLGFRPRWIMIKNISIGTAGQSDWVIYDTSRGTSNVVPMYLLADLANAEATSGGNEYIDILSNGFKLRGSSNYTNSSSYTYIYAAFAENPFKLSRAR